MYSTRFHRRIEGLDYLDLTRKYYFNIQLELKNMGHPLKQGSFERDSSCERANSSFLLANYTPLIVADLMATKWFGSGEKNPGSGEISLWTSHLNHDQIASALEEIANYYGLIKEPTQDNFACRR